MPRPGFDDGQPSLSVRCFGPLRGRVPARLEWRGGTLADLVGFMERLLPGVAPILKTCAFVAEGQWLRKDDFVPAGASVDILPPISGG